MNAAYLITGILLVSLTTFDALRTTLSLSGGGPLTRRMGRGLWAVALRLHRLRPEKRGLLATTGFVILLLTFATWIVLMVAGYWCLFVSDPEAVLNSTTQTIAGDGERLYYTGFTLFTLGMGDFVPGSDGWRVVTAAASLHGLFLVTLAITYMLPVVSAAVEKHALGAFIHGQGTHPVDWVRHAWDGESFEQMDSVLLQMAQKIEVHTQRHLAYPILHYFQKAKRGSAFAPNLAILHEALIVMTMGVDPEARLKGPGARALRSAMNGFLSLMASYDRHETGGAGPPILWERYESAGLPVTGFPLGPAEDRSVARERALVGELLRDCGWDWEDVRNDDPPEKKADPN